MIRDLGTRPAKITRNAHPGRISATGGPKTSATKKATGARFGLDSPQAKPSNYQNPIHTFLNGLRQLQPTKHPSPSGAQLLAEIRQQPAVLRTMLAEDPTRAIALPDASVRNIDVVAIGSSLNAARAVKDAMEAASGRTVTLLTPEQLEQRIRQNRAFGDNPQRLSQERFYVFISQSGESHNVLSAVEKLKKASPTVKCLAITNSPTSTLANMLPNALNLAAGPEKSIAATKSMTATMAALTLFALRAGGDQNFPMVRQAGNDQLKETLTTTPGKLETLSATAPGLLPQIKRFSKALAKSGTNQIVLISKGGLTGTLPEAELKMTETARVFVKNFESEDFKHGPKALLTERPNLIYAVPPMNGGNTDAARLMLEDMRAHFETEKGLAFPTNRVFIVAYENSPRELEKLRRDWKIPEARTLILPAAEPGVEDSFLNIVAFQLISQALSEAKHVDPNHHALSKAVTR